MSNNRHLMSGPTTLQTAARLARIFRIDTDSCLGSCMDFGKVVVPPPPPYTGPTCPECGGPITEEEGTSERREGKFKFRIKRCVSRKRASGEATALCSWKEKTEEMIGKPHTDWSPGTSSTMEEKVRPNHLRLVESPVKKQTTPEVRQKMREGQRRRRLREDRGLGIILTRIYKEGRPIHHLFGDKTGCGLKSTKTMNTTIEQNRITCPGCLPTKAKVAPIPEAPREFTGMIEEVRIHDRALTPTEVKALYARPRLSFADRVAWHVGYALGVLTGRHRS